MAKAKKPKKKAEWATQAAVYGALRRKFRMYPAYNQVLNEAKTEYYKPTKTGGSVRRVLFKCAQCGKSYGRKEVAVDHIDPVVGLGGIPLLANGQPDYNVYIDRLFCPKANLQVLCTTVCHKAKSKAENAERRQLRPKRTEKAAVKRTKAKKAA